MSQPPNLKRSWKEEGNELDEEHPSSSKRSKTLSRTARNSGTGRAHKAPVSTSRSSNTRVGMQSLSVVDSAQTISKTSLEERSGFTSNGRHAAEDRTLRHELLGGIAYGVPWKSFLPAIFGDTEWRTASELGQGVASSDHANFLTQAYLQKEKGQEYSLYQPFAEIVNYALEYNNLPYRCVVSNASILKGADTQRKPDAVIVRSDSEANPNKTISWEQVLVAIELKNNTTDMSVPPLTYAMPCVESANPRETGHEEGSKINLNGREQLGGYAASVLSAMALKRYTIGVLVNFTKLELWYYDRAGAIGSTTFDFRNDIATFLAIMIAFGRGSSHTFGYLPELVTSSDYPTRFEGLTIEDVIQVCPSTTVAEPSSNVASMIAVKVVSENIASPQTRMQRSEAASEEPPIGNPPRVLFGRGTTAYRCTAGRLNDLVVKLSWQPPDRRSEVDFLKMAHHIEGIPSLRGHRDISHLARGLRGILEEHTDDMYKLSSYLPRNMIFRAIVIEPQCVPLYSVSDLLTLMTAFKSLLKVHYDLSQRGIIHRDINVNNLMVKRSNLTHGVLIDLDFACEFGTQGETVNGQYGGVFTMCTPFLAISRVSAEPPPHIYRHDLESFLWTLIWISTYYNNGVRNRRNVLEKWYVRSWQQIRAIKTGDLQASSDIYPTATFLVDSDSVSSNDAGDFESQSTSASKSPFEGCLARLKRHVRKGYLAEAIWRDERRRAGYDDSTAGGHITYSNFRDEIDRLLEELQ